MSDQFRLRLLEFRHGPKQPAGGVKLRPLTKSGKPKLAAAAKPPSSIFLAKAQALRTKPVPAMRK